MPPFIPCELPGRVAKEVKMESIAEFGLTILHPTPFRPHVYMRFFVPVIGEGARGILARCTHCEKTEGANPVYRCHFAFFGVGDELLKRIRKGIREDYVQKKERRA
jgi:hypothetical protein